MRQGEKEIGVNNRINMLFKICEKVYNTKKLHVTAILKKKTIDKLINMNHVKTYIITPSQ